MTNHLGRLLVVCGLISHVIVATVEAVDIVIVDDFESEAIGSFPSQWLDVGDISPASTAPNPSAVVVSTQDAFGATTKAVRITGGIADSQGLYLPLPVSSSVSISIELRIDQFSSQHVGNFQQDWAIDAGLLQIQGEIDPSLLPSMGAYVSSLTESWHGFIIGTDGVNLVPDLATSAALDTWYRLELDLNPVGGSIRTQISEILSGSSLLDRTDDIPNWTPANGLFDAVGFYDGELSAEGLPNLVTFDNISVRATRIPEPVAILSLITGIVIGLSCAKRLRHDEALSSTSARTHL